MGSGGGGGVGGEARKIIPLPLARPCNRNTPAAAQNPFGEDGGDEEEWGKLIFRARKQKGGRKEEEVGRATSECGERRKGEIK